MIDSRYLLNRRWMLGLLSAATASTLLGACSNDDEEPHVSPTPTVTPEPSPTPMPTYPLVADQVPGYTDPEKWAGRTLAIAGRGGDYQEAQEEVLFDPFALATGASIQIKIADTPRLREQVDQGAV